MSDEDRLFVTALARGLELMRAFRPGEPSLGNNELARRSGLAKSTVSRLTHTLTRLGYLEDLGEGRGYRLGMPVLVFGHTVLSNFPIRQSAYPLMRRLAEDTGLSVTLAARDGLNMVYIEAFRAVRRSFSRLDVGSRVPLATTAIGRGWYVGAPQATLLDLRVELERHYLGEWPRIDTGLRQACEDYAQLGYTRSMGQFEHDIHAVGVPLVGVDPLLSLNISGVPEQMPASRIQSEIGPAAARLAREIAAAHRLRIA